MISVTIFRLFQALVNEISAGLGVKFQIYTDLALTLAIDIDNQPLILTNNIDSPFPPPPNRPSH